MRNFWIDARIDGRETRLKGGPRRKDGGFDLTIYVKDNGESVHGLSVVGRAQPDGSLRLFAYESSDAENVVDVTLNHGEG